MGIPSRDKKVLMHGASGRSGLTPTLDHPTSTGGYMQHPWVPAWVLFLFRAILYACALYFFMMGMLMMIFPELVTKNAGAQHPMILGILRGTGGSILGSTVFYILVALRPFERRWAAIVIALANVLAIALDCISVHLREYTLAHAMIDVPVETVSFLTIVVFYMSTRSHNVNAPSSTA
jgi:hypothetical protein